MMYMYKSVIRFAAIMMAAVASVIPSSIYAQEYENTPVTVSKEKLKIGDQICYSHIVLEKQTLFSICKAYNVTLEDIYRFNPSVKEKGLQKNSILMIPLIEEVKQEQPKVLEQPKEQEQAAPRKTHIVKWFEDLDLIAEKYGVLVEDIIKINGLKGRKLTRRQKLIIPSPGEIIEALAMEVPADSTAVADSVQIPDSTKDAKNLFEDIFFPKKEAAISLLLPLKADGSAGSTGNMDFYCGVLLAVYDMAEKGTSTDLSVYDVAGGRMPVTKERLEESDVVIGPVSPVDIEKAFEIAPEAKAIVSPLDQRAGALADRYTGLIQAPTPLLIQYNDLIDWIKEDMEESDRMLVVSEKGAQQTETILEMKAAADSSGIEYKALAYSILEGRNVTGSLEYLMTESGTNRVYITSDSEAFINDVVRNLNLMIHKKYDVVLYAPSRIRNYETIEVENLHNTSLHISTGYYIDYDDPRVQDFLLKYRALFNCEPTQFSFQGYDLASYFIGMSTKYGNRWYDRLDRSDSSMLQSTFRFRKDREGGYINTGVRRIIYGDEWSVVKVK